MKGKFFRQFNTIEFLTLGAAIDFIKSIGIDFYDCRVVFTKNMDDFKFQVSYYEEVPYDEE